MNVQELSYNSREEAMPPLCFKLNYRRLGLQSCNSKAIIELRTIVITNSFVDQFFIRLYSRGTTINMAASASEIETKL